MAATLLFAARYEAEDARNYLIPAVAALAVLAVLGVARLEQREASSRAPRKATAWAAAALAIAIPLAVHA